MTLALGIDVAWNRPLDCVYMTGAPGSWHIEGTPFACPPDNLVSELHARGRPDVIAIDSPPGPGTAGDSRLAERDLFRRGIGIFFSPSDPVRWAAPFYGWMRVGQAVYSAVAGEGYPLYTGGDVHGHALEVFPHASAVVLRGAVWPAGTNRSKRRKRQWRLDALDQAGVDTTVLSSLDEVDAALAALTGLAACHGQLTAVGDPAEGVIVVPGVHLPDRYPVER